MPPPPAARAHSSTPAPPYATSTRLDLLLAQWRLRASHPQERIRFLGLARGFHDLYRRLSRFEVAPYVTPLWRQFNSRLEEAFLPRPRFRFLRESTIRRTMFVDARGDWLASQAAYLLGRVQEDVLAEVLPDAPLGDPPLAWAAYRTSHNSVHHLTHLERYREHTGHDPVSSGAVVEWGGGYGNLARIFACLARARGRPAPTYTIIDTPLLGALQWLYLATVFGAPRVHIIDSVDAEIRPGEFNILPVGLLSHLRPRADLFISTWALSESSVHGQDLAASDWFGARRLLLASQESFAQLPDAGRIPVLARAAGAAVLPVPELPQDTYCFV